MCQKWRFADDRRTGNLSIGMKKFYTDGVVQAVTFVHLIY